MTKQADQSAADELELFIDNDADLHRQQMTPIFKNLATKKFKSQYKHDLAVKLFGYLVEAGAKKYAKEFGSGQPWNVMFNVPTRKLVAESMTKSFEVEFELGNYDHLLPKKHQKEIAKQSLVPTRHHSRKKTGDRLFMGVFSTGISYADRHKEVHGDYQKIAFLPFSSLELKWYVPEDKVPADLRRQILADAKRVASKRGEEYPISAAGQTVLLGGGHGGRSHSRKKTGAQLNREISSFLSRRGR